MNNFGSKMSGHSGDAANSLVEGYSKVDYTGTLLSVLSDLSEQDPSCPNTWFIKYVYIDTDMHIYVLCAAVG